MDIMTANKQNGAVSIFIVVFTALLITIITVGFLRIMARDQQQATASDLSQSAYDAASAGVEDAKRALARYYAATGANRSTIEGILNSHSCDTVSRILYGGSADETLVASDETLDQAYTCVKIFLQTDNYIGSLGADQSQVIPLTSRSTFDRVRIEWFSQRDLSSGITQFVVPTGASTALPAQDNWDRSRPPLLEAQLIQHGSDFTLGDFDSASSSQSNTNTLSLYPARLSSIPALRFADNVRRSPSANGLQQVRCLPNPSSETSWGNYSCRADIQLPTPVGGGSRSAYLRLTPRYNSTHYQVSLYNGSAVRNFDGVQPRIDSTGRANNLFRRIDARVEPSSSAVYPEAAVDITGNFCKVFSVTNRTQDYRDGNAVCTP